MTDDERNLLDGVALAARDLADYVRNNSFKHVTEAKLIRASDALESYRNSHRSGMRPVRDDHPVKIG